MSNSDGVQRDETGTIGLATFQRRIESMYLDKDRGRGMAATYMWFAEEVGELTRALRRGADRAHLEEEFADVLAWLSTLASISGVELDDAVERKYGAGCPYCRRVPCVCETG